MMYITGGDFDRRRDLPAGELAVSVLTLFTLGWVFYDLRVYDFFDLIWF